MLAALLVFLFGALVLIVVLYVCQLVIARMKLPDDVQQIALAIIGLLGLIALLILVVNVFNGDIVVLHAR